MSTDAVPVVMDRIEGRGLRVFDGSPSSPTYPYVVVWASSPRRTSNRAADVRVQDSLWWQTTTVGLTAEQCRLAAARVVDALSDWTPTIEGVVSHKVDHLDSQPAARDDSLPDREVFYVTDQWRLRSSPLVG